GRASHRSTWGAPTWPPHPPTLGAPRETRGAPRPPARRSLVRGLPGAQRDREGRERLCLAAERRAHRDADGARRRLSPVPLVEPRAALVQVLEGERGDARVVEDGDRVLERVPVRQRPLPDDEAGALAALAEGDDDGRERDRRRKGEGRRLGDELEPGLGAEEEQRRLRYGAAVAAVWVRGADRPGQHQGDAAHVLLGFGPVPATAPRVERDAQAAERDHQERGHERERDEQLEEREPARVAPHGRAPGSGG